MSQIIKKNIINNLTFFYRLFFLRKSLFKLNKLIFTLSLRGMGILNYENNRLSGEEDFLKKISELLNNSVVLDVGANVGNYSNKVRSLSPSVKIYAFEPHPKTFRELENQANQHNYVALNAACSDVEGKLKLYDYQGDKGASSHASLYQDVIDKIHKGFSESWEVDVTIIDDFVKLYNLPKISLLKIDVEGNELNVLLGAKKSIAERKIDIIQFEFTQLNVVSRVFMKDIYELLIDYFFYRMLPNGLVSLGGYDPICWEIFAYQNIVAIRKDFFPIASKYMGI